MLVILLASGSTCSPGKAPLQDAKTYVHFVSAVNEHYSLVYYGERCPHSDFTPLPEGKHDEVFSWTFNTSHAGVISRLDRFRILSRLATIDRRSESHLSTGPHAFGRLVLYKWTEFANQAYLGLWKGPTNDDVRIIKHLEKPLLEKKFIKPDNFVKYQFIPRDLSNANRAELAATFSKLEAILAGDTEMTTPTKTIDAAVHEVAEARYQTARRLNYTKFQIVK